jgi:hypothetical protein
MSHPIITFLKPRRPSDPLSLRSRTVRHGLISTLMVGLTALNLYQSAEQIRPGQQQLRSYVERTHNGRLREIIPCATVVFLTSGTVYTRPADWNNANNFVDVIGAGGNGSAVVGACCGTYGGPGGGGGGFARSNNVAIGATAAYAVGAPPSGATSFNSGTVAANGGASGSGPSTPGGAGGVATAANAIATSGGAGAGYSLGGGGGAAGFHGNGISSGSGTGGAGDAGSGGAGNGGNGNEYAANVGSGGGGQGNNLGAAGAGGFYGGGGGGGYSAAGVGRQGLIVLSYVPAAPTFSSCVPNTGPAAGGTSVTITGANFSAITSITFGGTAATSVVTVNTTTATCTTPAHVAGLVNIVVTNANGSATGTNAFTYLAASSGGFNIPMMGI